MSTKFIADLHIHSSWSISTSRDITPASLWKWGQLKGVDVLGTGDVLHPEWRRTLERETAAAGNGFLALRKGRAEVDIPASCRREIFLVPSAEVSCIYRRGERTRKVHLLALFPSLGDASRAASRLGRIAKLTSDGRPVFKTDAEEMAAMLLNDSPEAIIIPAHIWTPHFSVLGTVSGFESIEECFGGMAAGIFALETGLSSDPEMCRRIPALDRFTLVSNSDAHSPMKIGREANILETELSYRGLYEALRTREGFRGTVEYFPDAGKYHNDGHRKCGVNLHPKESRKSGGLCPACGKRMTLGVLNRVEDLASRKTGKTEKPFSSTLPLTEILAHVLGCGENTQKVKTAYDRLLADLGNELSILLEVPPETIAAVGGQELASAIGNLRSGNVVLEPGYDGVYGKIRLFPGS